MSGIMRALARGGLPLHLEALLAAVIRRQVSIRQPVAVDDDLDRRMEQFQVSIESRDLDLARDVLDDDYALVLVHPAQATMPRSRWLEVLTDYVVHDYEVQDQSVDVDGDCAAVLHRVRMSATVLGEDRSGMFVISDVWRRRSGSWRVWRRHSTPLAAGAMPGVSGS
jgi:ketosteroid isomerase-like protein